MSLETTVSSPPEPAPAEDRTIVLGEPARRLIAIGLGLLALVTLLVGLSVDRAPQLSPFDEWTHADYAYQVSHGHIPAKGSTLAPEILREFSCHGLWTPFNMPACGTKSPSPSQYPSRGEDYNWSHPPLYYAITGFITRGVDALIPGQHFITIARLVGILWLFTAMMVLYFAVRMFGAAWQFALAAAAAIPLIPLVLHGGSTVNNDAAAPVCGALALWLLGWVLVRKHTGWVIPLVLTVAATATKVLNGLPFLVVLGTFLVIGVVRWHGGDATSGRRLVILTAVSVVGFVVVYKGWAAFQSGRGLANWVNPVAGTSDRATQGLPFDELLSTSFTGLNFVANYFLPSSINGEKVLLWNRAIAAVASAAPFVALLAFRARTWQWLVGLTALLGVLAYPLVVEVQIHLDQHGRYFPSVVARYGIAFVPFLLAAMALAVDKRHLRKVSLGFVGIGAITMIFATSGIGH